MQLKNDEYNKKRKGKERNQSKEYERKKNQRTKKKKSEVCVVFTSSSSSFHHLWIQHERTKNKNARCFYNHWIKKEKEERMKIKIENQKL